ncbi:glycosyl hydrolase family 28 protein [Aquimarina sp. ERC-38]|uniref:glycoside hydrolase family 28 protein n=1 Tax=Aquimarina sp. ERC-38 TaxID=2949996 RepID=UPI0022483E51|nr:glycosyl hydrolase family 28 protein [Aquimarina sp. ERC-38]UZO82297.1 glycosyl hydrolase family 28 protein [Aquimarina sp. ERC-38]
MRTLLVKKYGRFLIFFCSIGVLYAFQSKTRIYDVESFGAKGDSLTINTTAIQKAIDQCSEEGGGIVRLKNGIYISGTIILKDNVTLHVQEQSKLVGSSNPTDYKSIDTFTDAVGQERGTCLIGALQVTNIGISGTGTIDGNGASFLARNLKLKRAELGLSDKKIGKNRPFLVRFVKSSQIRLQNIHLREAAAWACHFYQSYDIFIDGISIYNHANKNNDGIDLDSSHNVFIKNCNIDSGDDSICIKTTSPLPTYNVKVKNCTLKSDWGAIKLGTESMGDFYDISFKNCEIYDTKGGGIKILSVDGANIHDVLMEDIRMTHTEMPIFIRLGKRLKTYRDAVKRPVGSIKNVLIRNVVAQTRSSADSRVSPPSGILITGTPGHKIESVELENIQITLPGGGTVQHKDIVVPEDKERYPEFKLFGVLPAFGMYARHIDELKSINVTYKTNIKDFRFETLLKN